MRQRSWHAYNLAVSSVDIPQESSKADMRRRQIRFLLFTRRGAIAHTVIARAEERAALDDHRRVVPARGRRDRRGIAVRMRLMRAAVDVLGPLPCIADHVVQLEAVRRVAADGRETHMPVVVRIEHGEYALPVVRGGLAL